MKVFSSMIASGFIMMTLCTIIGSLLPRSASAVKVTRQFDDCESLPLYGSFSDDLELTGTISCAQPKVGVRIVLFDYFDFEALLTFLPSLLVVLGCQLRSIPGVIFCVRCTKYTSTKCCDDAADCCCCVIISATIIYSTRSATQHHRDQGIVWLNV